MNAALNPAELLGLDPSFVVSYWPQGSQQWLDERKACITGSRARDARERKAGTPEKVDKKTGEITPAQRGAYTQKAIGYAYDVAREREGGQVPGVYVNAAMRDGTAQEPKARQAYELLTGRLVEELGFVRTADRKFGVSTDGICFEVDATGKQVRGGIEIKTAVSSTTLFEAMVSGDISEYRDQCVMNIWMLHLDWIDLCLWAPDLPEGSQMRVIRIERNDDEIDALLADLMEFDRFVEQCRSRLREYIAGTREATQSEAEPTAAPAKPTTKPSAPVALPDLF